MVITNGNLPDANDVRNLFSGHGNVLVGQSGVIWLPIPIDNTNGARSVKLWLWGKKAGASANVINHGSPRHYHGQLQMYFYRSSSPDLVTDWDDSGPAWETSNESTSRFDWRFSGGDSNGSGNVGDSDYNTTIPYTAVPQAVQIWIDGSEYTATIGDPNSKGATMYDSANDDWGVDGSTEWETGELDLSSVISWTAGVHYLELKETGGTGGTLIWLLRVDGW